MESILRRAKSAGIQFEQGNAKDLELLSELQELLCDAERERTCLQEEGEDTTLYDKVIAEIRQEIQALSKKIK